MSDILRGIEQALAMLRLKERTLVIQRGKERSIVAELDTLTLEFTYYIIDNSHIKGVEQTC